MIGDIAWYLNEIVRFLEPFNWFIIWYFLAINCCYILLVIFSYFHIQKQLKFSNVYKLTGLFSSDLYKPVSILAPAYNEEANIVASVEALMQIQFPEFEVVVINDGSTDRTLELLIENFDLKKIPPPLQLPIDHEPIKQVYRSERFNELIVVDKVNGRKADALNAGINVASKELICAIDADSILEPDVLLKLLRAFVENENVVAVGGIVRVANGCTIENSVIKKIDIPKNYLSRIQSVEYLRAFLFGRVGWDYLNSLLIISGAFGVFDRNAVLTVGGYLHDTVGEDMELVVRLHRYHRENDIPYDIRFLPEPVCWTEVPEDWETLGRQRNRWQRGLADTIWRHKAMLFNPRYGGLGLMAMPFFLFFEMLGPIIEAIGFTYFFSLLLLGGINSTFVLLFFIAAVLLGMILSVASVLCEEFTFRRYPSIKNVAVLVGYAFLENIGYRQIHTWWRFKGLIDFVKGNKEWGEMLRRGLSVSDTNTTTEKIKEPGLFWKKVKNAGYWMVVGFVGFLLLLLVANVLWTEGLIPEIPGIVALSVWVMEF